MKFEDLEAQYERFVKDIEEVREVVKIHFKGRKNAK